MSKKKNKKTIHFVSLGCPKNRVDSEVMAGQVLKLGHEIVADPSDADVIVVNTCAFIERAREESVDTLLEMARVGGAGRCTKLIATGCMAQRYGAELAKEMPEVTHVVGVGDDQVSTVGSLIEEEGPLVTVGPPAHFLQGIDTPRFVEPGTPSAYVKIADGCSRKCGFCAIPGIRGKARSRPIPEIVAEAESLASKGVLELNLVAQDTSAYGRDLDGQTDLSKLIRSLDAVDGIAWIRLLYLYPDAVSAELLETIRDSKKTLPYLDIPIQHASANMLKRMRRGHGPEGLRRLVARIRRILPGGFLRTAVLVGHPGETEQDFAELIDFLKWARFDHLGAFRYSDEEGTPSFQTGPRVAPGTSYNRLRKVMALGKKISREANRALKNTTLQVLVESIADEQGYVLTGRHQGQAPEVDGVTYVVSSDARPGDIVEGRVVKLDAYDLVVEPL